MTAETGQGGADLSWTLSLNHQYATDLTKSQISETVANKLECITSQQQIVELTPCFVAWLFLLTIMSTPKAIKMAGI